MLSMPFSATAGKIAALGKSVGTAWGADQKNATIAALIALEVVVQSQ